MKKSISHIVTRESLAKLVTRPDIGKQALGRALVVIFNKQTEYEKRADTTNVYNNVGFTGADAYSGCLTAKFFLKHKTLADWQVERWLKPNKNGVPRICKYWKQLDNAAKEKAALDSLSQLQGS